MHKEAEMKRIVLACIISLLLPVTILCAADEKPLPNPEVLTEETILTGTRLSTYDTIIIKDFKTEGTEYTNVDAEEKPKVDSMKSMIVKGLSDSLEMELKKRNLFKTIQKNAVPTGKALILEGGFTEFNAGNRAVRFWVGFGAGKTYLKAKGRLVDAQTGKELATFVERETGYKGTMTMENFEGLFPSQAMSMGENIADFIQKLY
jgi:hypothetical protein